MPDQVLSNPLDLPVLLTGVAFDFLPEYVVISFEYPVEDGDIYGPKAEARFVVENGSIRALGAKLLDVATLVEKPQGSA